MDAVQADISAAHKARHIRRMENGLIAELFYRFYTRYFPFLNKAVSQNNLKATIDDLLVDCNEFPSETDGDIERLRSHVLRVCSDVIRDTPPTFLDLVIRNMNKMPLRAVLFQELWTFMRRRNGKPDLSNSRLGTTWNLVRKHALALQDATRRRDRPKVVALLKADVVRDLDYGAEWTESHWTLFENAISVPPAGTHYPPPLYRAYHNAATTVTRLFKLVHAERPPKTAAMHPDLLPPRQLSEEDLEQVRRALDF